MNLTRLIAFPQILLAYKWLTLIAVMSPVVHILSAIWLWKMQKRGFEIYALFTLIILCAVLISNSGILTIVQMTIPMIFIILLTPLYKKMHTPSFIGE